MNDGNSSRKRYAQPQLPNITEFMKKHVCCHLASNPKRGIFFAWFSSLLLVFTAFIVVCIAISRIKTGSANSAVSFAGMWTILLLIGVSVCGTLIMRKFQTSIAIGFLLGIFFVLSNQMLIIFAIFIDHSKREVIQETIESDKAFAAFSFLLFLVYGIFGTMLGIFRNDVIKEVTLNEDDAVSGDKQANGNI